MIQRLGNGVFKKLVTTSLVLLAITTCVSAHADFRKALDAYIARDGTTMLKEVKDAVDKRNDDGLILFLNALVIDYSSSKNGSRNIYTSSTKSTYEAILTDEQQQSIRTLLDQAAEGSSPKAQWLLLNYPNFSNRLRPTWWEWQQSAQEAEKVKSRNAELRFSEAGNRWSKLYQFELNKVANSGSADAAERLYQTTAFKGTDFGKFYSKEDAIKWMTKSAELGSPYMAITLGFKYLHWNSSFPHSNESCDPPQNENAICLIYDKSKGLFWLKQAVRYVDKYPMGFGGFMYEMGNINLSGAGDKASNPHQAYLWYLLGINSLTNVAIEGQSEQNFIEKLGEMRKNGQLKIAAPELDAVWDDVKKRDAILHPRVLTELPNWIAEARKNDIFEKPVFSYVAKDRRSYSMNVYEDGRVTLDFLWNGIRSTNNEIYLKTSPKKVKEFLNKLHQIGVHDWPLSRPSYGKEVHCMDMILENCNSNDYLISLKESKAQRNVLISQDAYSTHLDKIKAKNILQVFALVEEYFSTQKLRCTLGTSTKFNQDCMVNDQKMIDLAKLGEPT